MEDPLCLLDDPKVGTISCFANCFRKKRFAVTYAKSEILHIYNYKNHHKRELTHSGNLRTWCLSNDGRFAASGSEDGTVKVWNIKHKPNTEICFIKQDSIKANRIRSLAFSPDNAYIAVSMYNKQIHIFEVDKGTVACKIGNFLHNSNENLIGSPCIISDEEKLIVGGDDGNCKGYVWRWDNISDSCKQDIELIGHSRGIRSIATKDNFIITGSYDTSVIL